VSSLSLSLADDEMGYPEADNNYNMEELREPAEK
jgi:hypothetical protein